MAAASPANADTPHGFNATGVMYGLNAYDNSASNLAVFKGDMMSLENNGLVTENTSTLAHNVGAAETVGAGSVSNSVKALLAANTAGTIMVHYHPAQIYYGQIDASGTPAVSSFGENADLEVAAHVGNTTTGFSGMEISATTLGTAAALVMSIHGLLNRSDNLIGDHAELTCSVNEHFMSTNVGVGV
jgi:hypothetical protein